MAELRPFRGLRYTRATDDLSALLAPPSSHLSPAERGRYVARQPHNVILLASPEGDGDDRSKFVRFARGAARLAEWRRESVLQAEAKPSLYRLTQRIGHDRLPRVTLFAVVPTRDLLPVEAVDPRQKEERLRLLEATRTFFEPAVAFYADPDGGILAALREAAASAEVAADLDGAETLFETIDNPEAIAKLEEAFRTSTLYVADGVDAVQAAQEAGGDSVLVALASLNDPTYARLPVHRVVRRLPGGHEAALSRLATLCNIEEHHSRNLMLHIDQAAQEGRKVFGMATEGGLGYLLTPRGAIESPASAWFEREVFGGLLGVGEVDPTLTFTDPVQAIRAANEGAAAAFLMPTPARTEVLDAYRSGVLLPAHSVQTYPAVPTGLVFWSLGDDA